MRKRNIRVCLILFTLLLLTTAATVYAQTQKVVSIKSGEVTEKSWYVSGDTISNEGLVGGDMITAGSNISSSGTIEKDLIGAARAITNTGTVNGDIICAAEDISVSGKVLGNMRAAASEITVNGNIGKNVNVFSSSTTIENTADLGGNLIAFSEKIKINGKVQGDTLIHAKKITLNGEFFGDVSINPSSTVNVSEDDTSVVISPETIIHGKLTYTGLKQVQVPQGAKISNYEWIKTKIAQNTEEKASNYIYKFIKLLFTTAIYYLIAMLLYKLFPEVFRKHGEIISEKPMKVFSVGLLSLASTFIAFFVFIILLVMSFVISPSIGLVFGSAVLLMYILIFFFSTVPVSLWLGNKIFKDKYSLPYRFAGGLSLITFGLFAIKVLAEMPSFGFVFGMLSFSIGFTTLTFGAGALLYVKKVICLPTDKVDNA